MSFLSFIFKKNNPTEIIHLRWDFNSFGQALNPATSHGLPTEITHLVSGLNETQVLDVTTQKEFNERQSDR